MINTYSAAMQEWLKRATGTKIGNSDLSACLDSLMQDVILRISELDPSQEENIGLISTYQTRYLMFDSLKNKIEKENEG